MPLTEYEYITVKFVEGIAVVTFRESEAMFEGGKVQAVGKELMDLVENRFDKIFEIFPDEAAALKKF